MTETIPPNGKIEEGPLEEESVEARRARARARTEAKNQAVRDQLVPLEPGERPGAVTVASIAAMLLAIGNIVAYVLSDHPSGPSHSRDMVQLVLICVVLFAASIGMWLTKYWAVLGFQTVLGLQIIVYCLALTRVERLWTALLFLVIIAASCVLFWYLIRAMARIQMPESPEQKLLREREEAITGPPGEEQHD